ncbi:hypothetical protein HY227_02735, partial [Candidatus Wolfebacteria bacterium]|nr:hypothetical protein [Candidatus Wolfebacteria bacterium]
MKIINLRNLFLLFFVLGVVSIFGFVNNAHAAFTTSTLSGNAAADLVVGATDADYNILFDTNVSNTASTITVTFPTGYTITDGNLGQSAVCNSGCSATGMITVNGGDYTVAGVTGSTTARTVKLTLSPAVDLSQGTGASFRITSGITNATTSGATATSSITTNASTETVSSTNAFTLTPGTATQLVFTQQPASATSGIALVTQPIVTARDTYGNTATGYSSLVTLTEASAGYLSTSTASTTAASGIATFSGLIYTATADQQSFALTASDGSLTSSASNALTADVVATKIIVYQQPASATSGVAIVTPPIIHFTDAQNVLDTAANTDTVTAAVYTGGGTLSGTAAVAASNGVVTFSNLIYTSSTDGSAFVLSFTDNAGGTNNFSTASTTANSINVDVVATQLVFTTQPASATSGVALVTQPVVKAEDATGAVDTGFTDLVTLTEASAGYLSTSTASTTAVLGVATFSGLIYTATADQQSFTLTADDETGGSGGDLPTVAANALTADVVATKIIVYQQPASATSGVAIVTPPIIHFTD